MRAAAEAGRYDDELWRELCELGWPGIAIAEEHGGQGLGAVELAVLLEELGYAVAAVPLLGSALAALAIEHAGDDEQRARWLPGLATGELTGAFGGAATLIADAAGADVIVLVEDGAPRVRRARRRRRRAGRRDRPDAPLRARRAATGRRSAATSRARSDRAARRGRGRARRRLPARARHDASPT